MDIQEYFQRKITETTGTDPNTTNNQQKIVTLVKTIVIFII